MAQTMQLTGDKMFENFDADQMLEIARTNVHIDHAINGFFETGSIDTVFQVHPPSLEEVAESVEESHRIYYGLDGKEIEIPKPPEKGFWQKLKIGATCKNHLTA